MSVAGVKESRLKAITAIVPAISDISTSAMAGFFKPEEEVKAAKEAYEKGEGGIEYLNFMPRAFEEGAAQSHSIYFLSIYRYFLSYISSKRRIYVTVQSYSVSLIKRNLNLIA